MRTLYFMRWRHVATIISVTLILFACLSLALRGLNWGLDFSGGTLVEIRLDQAFALSEVRTALAEAGFPDASVQRFDNPRDLLIKVADTQSADLAMRIMTVFQTLDHHVEMRRVEFVGGQVGAELAEQSVIGALVALLLILLYIAFRFQLKFGIGAIIALLHDVLIILGIFSFWGIEFNLSVFAAVLAIIGYSLNDTIVVADRVRENFRLSTTSDSVATLIDRALNQVLGRTLITSFTTLMVLLALLLFGGNAIFGFALALTIGVVAGTYSSIYIAASSLLYLCLQREDVLPELRPNQEQNIV